MQGSLFQKLCNFCSTSFPLLFVIRHFKFGFFVSLGFFVLFCLFVCLFVVLCMWWEMHCFYYYFPFFPMVPTTALKTFSEKLCLNFEYES